MITTQEHAIQRLIEWRANFLSDPLFKVDVLQEPRKGCQIGKCYQNAFSAPKEFTVVAGWLVSHRQFKFKTGKNKELRVFAITPHYWNAVNTPWGQKHFDGTPFMHSGNRFNGGLIKNCAYIVDMALYDFPRICAAHGFNISAVAPSFLLDQDGDFIEIVDDKISSNVVLEGSIGHIYHRTIFKDGEMIPEFKNIFEGV